MPALVRRSVSYLSDLGGSIHYVCFVGSLGLVGQHPLGLRHKRRAITPGWYQYGRFHRAEDLARTAPLGGRVPVSLIHRSEARLVENSEMVGTVLSLTVVPKASLGLRRCPGPPEAVEDLEPPSRHVDRSMNGTPRKMPRNQTALACHAVIAVGRQKSLLLSPNTRRTIAAQPRREL